MHRQIVLLALGAIALGGGCRSKSETASPHGLGEAKQVSTSIDGAMCKEHGVLEAVCTKCNPKLIPVFQAKGDWCAEHGFPESFCPTCHPERGGKPQANVNAEQAPAEGTRVRLNKKGTAQRAGLQTAKATERASSATATAPARLTYDATKVAHVNARSAGVVRALKVDIGTQVKKGQPLLTIDSPEVGGDRARLNAAQARVEVARENFARQQQLESEGITSRKSLGAAEQELEVAKSEHAAISASLSILGPAAAGSGAYSLTAPLAGVVTERRVGVGKLVSTDEVLFEIVDTSTMWAELDVPEADLTNVRSGQPVSLRFEGLPEREFQGAIVYVAPAVDPHTRTAKARVPLSNQDGLLRANMYGEARVNTGTDRKSVVVPHAAVQRAKDVHLVFVRVNDDEYETRRVQLGRRDGDLVEVLKGIRAGEEVVTTGSFLLKTETLKSSIGAGCCD